MIDFENIKIENSKLKKIILIIISLFFILVIIQIYRSSPIHDYPYYMKQWENTIFERTPYHDKNGEFNLNAYGPTHNLFAVFYYINSNLPRVIFAGIWLLAGIVLLFRMLDKKQSIFRVSLMLLVLFINPYLYKLYIHGQNDLFASALIYFAIICHLKEKDIPAGILLSLSLMFKLYAIVFVPFFLISFIDRPNSSLYSLKMIKLKFITSFILTTCIGYFSHSLIFYDSVLTPFQFFVNREPTSSSIIYFISNYLNGGQVINYSLPLTLILLIILFVISYLKRIYFVFSCIVGLYILFLFSRVFYFPYLIGGLIIIADYFFVINYRTLNKKTGILYLYFLSLALIYSSITIINAFYPNIEINDCKGLIYFIPNLLFIIFFILFVRKNVLTK